MTIDDVTQEIERLYTALSEFEGISGWVGPYYDFGGSYEQFFDVDNLSAARSRALREGALVMLLFATWCSIEEYYVLTRAKIDELLTRVKTLTPIDDRDKKLIDTVRMGLEMAKNHDDSHYDAMEIATLDRESRWVLKEIVT